MGDSFGHWLAGFTDGEGAFSICRVTSYKGNPNHKTWPNCRFVIGLRADDKAILQHIQAELGFGSLFRKKPTASRTREQEAVAYEVHRIDDCRRIVEFFHRYPLRAKKRAQFLVWADAVHEMTKGPGRSDAFIEECRARLAELRKFVPADLAQIEDTNPPMLRHHRDYGTAPICLCGCGATTKIISHTNSVSHPDNPNYCAYVKTHYFRVLARERHLDKLQRKQAKMSSALHPA